RSADFPQAFMVYHCVSSCHLPSLSLYESFTAIEKRARVLPESKTVTSGCPPNRPIKLTLFLKLFMCLKFKFEKCVVCPRRGCPEPTRQSCGDRHFRFGK